MKERCETATKMLHLIEESFYGKMPPIAHIFESTEIFIQSP